MSAFSTSYENYENMVEFRIIHCKLFNDTVTEYLCSLRKRELSGQGAFSCTECRERGNSHQ